MKNKQVCIADWLSTARCLLEGVPGHSSAEVRLETQVLLAHALHKPRAWVLAHPEAALSAQALSQLDGLLKRLAEGEPLPYLLGHWEFYGLDFEVTPAVLIPRPETELLVEQASNWLRLNPGKRWAADVGTGSGCIAITLARQFPVLQVLAVDRSRAALRVAQRNAVRLNVQKQITFMQGDLLSAVSPPFDLVCANLPYIPTTTLSNLPVAQHEPRLALDGGLDGLQAIRTFLADAPRWLKPGGLCLLEMQYDQGDSVSNLAQAALPPAQVQVIPDLAGLPRLVSIQTLSKDKT